MASLFREHVLFTSWITLSSKSLTFNWIFLVLWPCCVVPGCTSDYMALIRNE